MIFASRSLKCYSKQSLAIRRARSAWVGKLALASGFPEPLTMPALMLVPPTSMPRYKVSEVELSLVGIRRDGPSTVVIQASRFGEAPNDKPTAGQKSNPAMQQGLVAQIDRVARRRSA